MRTPKGMAGFNRLKTTPIPVQRTTRPSMHRILTSLQPGKMVPVMAMPLLREDSVASAVFRISFEMKETVEVLMNAVNARVLTYLVPKTAMGRHDGMDAINKSYEGLPLVDGGDVTPWFESVTVPDAVGDFDGIYRRMGKHAPVGSTVNTDYARAYNAIWNFRAKQRSPDIGTRDWTNLSLAPAFWQHQTFAHIVPDFDQAIIDGEVALNIVNSKMPVKGIGFQNTGTPNAGATAVNESDGTSPSYPAGESWIVDGTAGAGIARLAARKNMTAGLVGNYPDIWAELQNNGITVSLSNIDMARKTQAFANLRRQYSGHSDEYVIDLLMDGITIPELTWKQPILLGDTNTVFGMSKRYATDAENLTESVVNGGTIIEQRFSCPRVPMGGVIMMVVEVTPEQLFERQMDPYFHATTVDELPQFLRDTLDPEKVQVVRNNEIDLDHDTPNGTFGYAPLNHQWARNMPQIGGKFYRPAVDAPFDEDRQRIWAVETQNPVLSEDFYLCTTMHQKPFVVTTGDNFEVLIRGEAAIRGNTVFGGLLVEATNDYAEVVEEQPTDRIEKD